MPSDLRSDKPAQKVSQVWKRTKASFASLTPRAHIVGTVFATLFFLVVILPYIQGGTSPPPFIITQNEESIKFGSKKSMPPLKNTGKIHLLMHAPTRDASLCKSILSSQILGYPSPVLLTGGKTGLDKIKDAHKYLSRRPAVEDQDYVLLVDGYDLWFQLPSTVMIQRFHRIAQEHLQRVEDAIGKPAVRHGHIDQTIIFSSQKHCERRRDGTFLDDEPMCWAVPESPMRPDLYGDDTDKPAKEGAENQYRPRWLGGGFAVGRLGAMRKLMKDAVKHAKTTKQHDENDKLIFGKLFGDQEYYRSILGRKHRTLMQRLLGTGQPKVLDAQERHPEYRSAKPLKEGEPYPEYGIGLDYGFELSHPARGSEWDARFLRHSTPDDLRMQQYEMGVKLEDFRVDWPLPKEVMTAAPPYILYSKTEGADYDTVLKGWHDIPLFTNVYTANVPLTMNLNTDAARLQEAIWHEMWYHHYLRQMLDGRGHTGIVGAFGLKDDFIQFRDVCDDFQDEVFRDMDDQGDFAEDDLSEGGESE